MDHFNNDINESNDADAIDLGFANRSDFSSNDLDRVLESHDNLLNTIEPLQGCDNSLFLNPINDFFSDKNEYGIYFCNDPTLISPKKLKESKAANNDCNVHEPAYSSASISDEFFDMIEKRNTGSNSLPQPHIKNADFGVCSLNEYTDLSVLKTNRQEFVSADYSFLGTENSSALNQWFLNLEQQQHMDYNNVTTLANICQQDSATISVSNKSCNNGGSTFIQTHSEDIKNSILSFPSCTTFNSIPTDDNIYINCPLDLINNQAVPDITHSSVIYNETNKSKYLLPISVKNSIHQLEQDSYSNLISNTETQPFIQTKLCCNSDNRNITAENFRSFTLPNEQSFANISCLKNKKSLSIFEPVYESKALSGQQLHTKCSHNLAFNLEQTNSLNWAAVFPRTHIIQSPEMIIMHPLRTRKRISSRCYVTTSNIGVIRSDKDIKPVTATIVPLPVSSAKAFKSSDPLNSLYIMTNNDKNSDKCDEHIQKLYEKEAVSHERVSLAEYFNTTSFNIPMIKERSRADGRNENRRKQKLHIIPGAENLIFEVQQSGESDGDVIQIQTTISEINKTINSNIPKDPYPESEIPELDEIFRRKKKSNNASAAGSKRTYQISKSISVGNSCGIKQNKHSPNSKLQEWETVTTIKESSNSFEEKSSVSIDICKEKSNLVVIKNDLTLSSESESVDEDDKAGRSQAGIPLKCNLCNKPFKTTRSLAIHTKRCVNLNQQNEVVIQGGYKSNHNKDKAGDVKGQISKQKFDSELVQSPKSTLKSNDIQELNVTSYMCNESVTVERNLETSFLNIHHKTNPRPITRSQTRRSTDRSIPYSALARLSK